jgi:hypothetical protein
MRVLASGIVSALGVVLALSTANSAGLKPRLAAVCAGPEYHQFDFWIGDWDVRGPKGKQAGVNHIRSILDGCVLQENWSGAGGSTGTSYNIYDRTQKKWHQTWVDNQGTLLQLDGAFSNGRMVMQGTTRDSTGAEAQQRITWSQPKPATVRQLWETSTDGGKSWTIAFDGFYSKQR